MDSGKPYRPLPADSRTFSIPLGSSGHSPSRESPYASSPKISGDPNSRSSLILDHAYPFPYRDDQRGAIIHGGEPPNNRFTARFLVTGILRWLVTAILSGLYYLTIRLYRGRTLSLGQKSAFDAIIVALSIALGLNIAAALRETAIHMRWWFLSKRQLHIREVEVHSLWSLIGLLWRSPSPMLKVVCVLWIVLNIAIQGGISALSLTFKGDPGVQDIYLDTSLDSIAIPDMSQFARVGRFFDGNLPQSFAAHILGDIGSSYNYSSLPVEPLKDEPIAKYPSVFWNATTHWEYVYMNSAPVAAGRQDLNFLSVFANRSVRSSARCSTPPFSFTVNTTQQVVRIRQTENPNRSATFPSIAMGSEAIYYLTDPVLGNRNSTGECGPGCSTVHIFEIAAGPPAEGSFVNETAGFFYYECNTTVASSDTTDPFGLSPTNAAVAAQAIALSGQLRPELLDSAAGTNQYTSYNFGLQFGEAQNNSASGIADMVARFAIGVVAAAAQTNPKLVVPGRQPRQGVQVILDEPVAFAAVLCVAAGLQLALLLVAAAMVRGVDIPEDVLVEREDAARKYIEFQEMNKGVRRRRG